MPNSSSTKAAPSGPRAQKKETPPPAFLLAQAQEIQDLMARFQAAQPSGLEVQSLEGLIRAAIFKPANALVGHLLQEAANRFDAFYQLKPGQVFKGRQTLQVQGLFGRFKLRRDHYFDNVKFPP